MVLRQQYDNFRKKLQKFVQLVKFHISIVDFSAGLICVLHVSHDMQVVIRQVQIK